MHGVVQLRPSAEMRNTSWLARGSKRMANFGSDAGGGGATLGVDCIPGVGIGAGVGVGVGVGVGTGAGAGVGGVACVVTQVSPETRRFAGHIGMPMQSPRDVDQTWPSQQQ